MNSWLSNLQGVVPRCNHDYWDHKKYLFGNNRKCVWFLGSTDISYIASIFCLYVLEYDLTGTCKYYQVSQKDTKSAFKLMIQIAV